MLIRNHEVIRNQKGLLLLMLMDILITYTDEEHKITKEKLRSKVNEIYGFRPSRNTLYEKLSTLESAGFPIEMSRGDGVYYNGNDLTNGELRFLVDSVMYSGFASHTGANEIIEALGKHGTLNYREYLKKQKFVVKKTRKNIQKGVFYVLEIVQDALFQNRQIRCNYFKYRADLTTENIYPEPIVINPYELVYKNGKYHMLGAEQGDDQLLSWRVDHICEIKMLESRCVEIPFVHDLRASGGMNAYIDSQPNLCGGAIEIFVIQCLQSAIDEVVDAFGKDFTIASEQSKNFDDNTVILRVRATLESMKAWVFTHANSVVVLSPQSFRDEIDRSLDEARQLYKITGESMLHRMHLSKEFSEAIHFSKMFDRTRRKKRCALFYNDRGNRYEKKEADLALLSDYTDLKYMFLYYCNILNAGFLQNLNELRSLGLQSCSYDLESLAIPPNIRSFHTDNEFAVSKICRDSDVKQIILDGSETKTLSMIHFGKSVQMLELRNCDTLEDCSALIDSESIEDLEIYQCKMLTDFSFLWKMPHLKSLRIRQEHFSSDDAARLFEQTGCSVRWYAPSYKEETDKVFGNPRDRKPYY